MDDTYGNPQPARSERKRKDHARRERQRTRKDEIFANDNAPNLIWSNQSIVPPQRMMANGDASYTPFPVHVSYPLEPFQTFSLYPSVYPMAPPAATFCPIAPARKGRKGGTLERSDKFDAKQVPQLTNQQYASLPPVNFEPFSPKSTDSDSNSKRHFSDPGPASTDDSDDSDSSMINPMHTSLQEEVNDLREKCRRLAQDLSTTKQELLDIKIMGCSKCSISDLQPGHLTNAISELRLASQTREDSIFDKVQTQLNISSDHHNQKLSAFSERLASLEVKLSQLEPRDTKDASISTEQNSETMNNDEPAKLIQLNHVCGKLAETPAPDAFTKVRLLEDEKTKLEVELQKAVHERSEAETNAHRLERLVSILRQKINGLSEDSCLTEENQARPIIPAYNLCESNMNMVSGDLAKLGSQSHSKINGNALQQQSLTSAKSNLVQPPSIPPRPNVFSTPTRPKTSPPNRPIISPPNFSVGEPVGPHAEILVESGTSTEASSGTPSITGPESLGGTITITGPVTDL